MILDLTISLYPGRTLGVIDIPDDKRSFKVTVGFHSNDRVK
jgi:hypothetical protein